MCKRTYSLVALLFLVSAYCEEPKPASVPTPAQASSNLLPQPKSPMPPGFAIRPPNQDWIAALERIRVQPRAGEITNGTVNATVSDVFSDSADAKTKATALAADYEKALLEKAAKWESELKELRAQFEAKMIAELPDAKREAVQKFIDASRTKWAEASDRDAKTRKEFLDRMRSGPRTAQASAPAIPNAIAGAKPANPNQPGADASAWMREERMRAVKQDEESVKTLRELLTADDAARYDRFNRSRPFVMQPAAKPAAVSPPAVPQVAAPVAPPAQPVEPPKAPASDAPKAKQ